MNINELKKLTGRHCVYILKHPLSKVIIYVGYTHNPFKRRQAHTTTIVRNQPKLKALIDDIREGSYTPLFEIIGVFDSKQVAISMEETLIKKLNPIGNTHKKDSL